MDLHVLDRRMGGALFRHYLVSSGHRWPACYGLTKMSTYRGVAASHIIALRRRALLTITLPTIYLWICDACALRRGTWVIERGTKLGISAWGLEIE